MYEGVGAKHLRECCLDARLANASPLLIIAAAGDAYDL